MELQKILKIVFYQQNKNALAKLFYNQKFTFNYQQ